MEDYTAEMIKDMAFSFCPQCGAAIVPNHRGRPRKFCSPECRSKWNNTHPRPQNWKTVRSKVCPVCGREFSYNAEGQNISLTFLDKSGHAVCISSDCAGVTYQRDENGTVVGEQYFDIGLTTPPSFGFGSLVATDYNISNTAPLVMWWGSLEESDNSPVGCWYPLLPRRDNKKLYSYVAEEESAVSIYSCTPILKTVYRLAVEEYQNERERSRERTGEHRVVDLMSLDLKSLVEERKQSELLSYLLSLNFENLKVVQTVMYIGRDYETMIQTEYDDEYDGEYDEEDFSRNTISFPVPNPDFVLYEWLRDLEECKGWKSKRIEAEQVYQKKLSLHIYLERAFRILGIECQ